MKNVGKVILACMLVAVLVPSVAVAIATLLGTLGMVLAAPWVTVPLLLFGAGGMALCYIVVKAVITLVFHK